MMCKTFILTKLLHCTSSDRVELSGIEQKKLNELMNQVIGFSS